MIDSHCHLGIGEEWKTKDLQPSVLLEEARTVGVEEILTVACGYDDVADLKEMLMYPKVFGAFGIHPENADSFDSAHVNDILDSMPEIVGYGEIGLDYFYSPENRQKQIKVFEKQIEIASERNLPIIIHTRDAQDDTIQILSAASNGGLLKSGGVLHCFTGSLELAEEGLNKGLYISASGIITFGKATELRATFQQIPTEKLLVETDAPYLAPVPYRGKMNQPAYVVETAKRLAEIKNLTLNELNDIVVHNFKQLFLERKR